MESLMVWLLVIVAFLVANVPWMSERFFVFFAPPGGVKRAWMRLLEWVVLYFVVGLLALGLEHKVSGENHPVCSWCLRYPVSSIATICVIT